MNRDMLEWLKELGFALLLLALGGVMATLLSLLIIAGLGG